MVKVAAVVKVAAAIAVSAAFGLATAPSQAQAPDQPTAQAPVAKKKPVQTQVANARPPAKVTVRKRSYLDPGTETKTHAEHYQDYAFPPGDSNRNAPGAIGGAGDSRFDWNRMPFPSCIDLLGFCR
jgi:methylthioribose-1-phosphate isomerase